MTYSIHLPLYGDLTSNLIAQACFCSGLHRDKEQIMPLKPFTGNDLF